MAETTHWSNGLVLECDLFGVPVLLQTQQLRLELIPGHPLPVYGHLHVGCERAVELGAEQVDRAGSEMNPTGWGWERDVGRIEDFRYRVREPLVVVCRGGGGSHCSCLSSAVWLDSIQALSADVIIRSIYKYRFLIIARGRK